MTGLLKRLLVFLRSPIDYLLALLLVPCALLLLAYRRFGSGRLPVATGILRKIGVFPIRNHYYEPLFDYRALGDLLSEDRKLPGVDLNVPGQMAFLEKLVFGPELASLRLDVYKNDVEFCLDNPSFLSGDADILYQFVRAMQPRTIIEIGSGYSTKLARMAAVKNSEVGGVPARHVCIEPYEMPWLETLGMIEVVRKRVEDCDINWGVELRTGDLLFIDSSHMIRPRGDVLKEYLEIFPQLASGVYIHIHDIFTPRDYPKAWLINDVRFWNEQYLLEALLSNTDRYEVVGALNFLKHHYYDDLKRVCPYLTKDREPGSFYMRVR